MNVEREEKVENVSEKSGEAVGRSIKKVLKP
jgi:hypothetical protein